MISWNGFARILLAGIALLPSLAFADYIPRPLNLSEGFTNCDFVVVGTVTKSEFAGIDCPRTFKISIAVDVYLKGHSEAKELTFYSSPDVILDLDIRACEKDSHVVALIHKCDLGLNGTVFLTSQEGDLGFAIQRYFKIFHMNAETEKDAAFLVFAKSELAVAKQHEVVKFSLACDLLELGKRASLQDADLEAIVFKAAQNSKPYVSACCCLVLENLRSKHLAEACASICFEVPPELLARNKSVREAIAKAFAAEKDPNHYYLLMRAFCETEPREMLESLKVVWTENKPAREFLRDYLKGSRAPLPGLVTELEKIQ